MEPPEFDFAAHPRPTRQPSGPRRLAVVTAAGCALPATLSLREAADALNVTRATLLAWEARYGYPTIEQVAGERRYDRTQIQALARHLQTDLSIPAAIAKARPTR